MPLSSLLADIVIPMPHWPTGGINSQVVITMLLIGGSMVWAGFAVHNATKHGASFLEAITLGLVSLTGVLEKIKQVRPQAKADIDKTEEAVALALKVMKQLQPPLDPEKIAAVVFQVIQQLQQNPPDPNKPPIIPPVPAHSEAAK